MIVRSNYKDVAYAYAQALDNSGDAKYLCLSDRANVMQIDQTGKSAVMVRNCIDGLQQDGRNWNIAGDAITLRVSYKGDCILKVNPLTKDVAGRISPVLFVMNVYGGSRHSVMSFQKNIETELGRKISETDKAAFRKVNKILSWPAWLIFFHVVLFSRKVSYD